MDDRSDLKIMGLGPMAVVPARQRQGIGSMLVTAGLNACRAAGVGAVIVLGHPHYYPRFGFESAALYDIQCKYDAPDGAFMVLELKPDYLRDASGMIRYHSAFDGL